VDGLWATKREGVVLIVRAITFQDFQPRPICDPDLPTSQTDRPGLENGKVKVKGKWLRKKPRFF